MTKKPPQSCLSPTASGHIHYCEQQPHAKSETGQTGRNQPGRGPVCLQWQKCQQSKLNVCSVCLYQSKLRTQQCWEKGKFTNICKEQEDSLQKKWTANRATLLEKRSLEKKIRKERKWRKLLKCKMRCSEIFLREVLVGKESTQTQTGAQNNKKRRLEEILEFPESRGRGKIK